MWWNIVFAAAIFLQSWSKVCTKCIQPSYQRFEENYDYIIVGAGSAGCIVAGRLAEDRSNRILVIEAGDDDVNYPDIKIPYNAGLLSKQGLDWKYKTTPQKNVLGKGANKSITWSRGKVLGGSGNTNYMGYDRGSQATFNLWGKIASPDWSYDNILPVFNKMEAYHDSEQGFRGTKGPLTIIDVKSSTVGEAFVKAGAELGYKITDTNGKDEIGFMLEQANIRKGYRWSSAFAYLHPAMKNNPHLKVFTNTMVTKIIFEDKKAIGVNVLFSDNTTGTFFAGKEIILSAGMIASPQILMLSGIGPKQHLKKLKIPVIADLPVGKNLQEQILVSYPFITDKPIVLKANEVRTPENIKKWNETGEGPLASTGSQGHCIIRSSYSKSSDPPDLALYQKTFSFGCKKRGTVSEEEFQFYEAICKYHGFNVFVLNTQPQSKGEIRLKSTDPKIYPIIDYQYWENSTDLEIIADGLMFLCQMNKTEAFVNFRATLPDIPYPPCKRHNVCTKDYFKCYAKYFTGSMSHASGTCKMGNDDFSVVDPELKVRGGITHLRVCDASIFPIIPSASLNGPSMMVGEKCAELIKQANRLTNAV